MPYAKSIEIATATNGPGYLILLEKKSYTFIRSRYLNAWSFFHAIMPQLLGDWFYDWRCKTGKIRIWIPV